MKSNKFNNVLLILCTIILNSISAININNENNTKSIDLNREGRRFDNNLDIFGSSSTSLLTRKFDDTEINDNINNDNNEQTEIKQLNYHQQKNKPLNNIFMGIYKNYRSTYLGNRTSLEYKKSLQDSPSSSASLWTEIISEKSSLSPITSEAIEKNTEIISETTSIKPKKKKKKKKKNKNNKNPTNNKNKGSITKKDEALLYSYDNEYRYNLGPGVNLTLDMNRDIVDVNLDEDCLKDILYQKWNGDSLGRGRGKKHEMLSKILPLFILPFLIQSAIIPFLVAKLKLLLVNSILIGKLAIFLLIISAIKNNQKTQSYEAAPAYWASEPSRRSEIFNGYRVEGRPTTWVN